MIYREQYRAYWKDHIVRMSTDRVPKEDLKTGIGRKKMFRKSLK
jgi:hypothetical protein